jgi:biotin carboxyl carrier protein
MPGTVLEVLVAEGDSVEEGQDLLVVEAMKMEHRLQAGRAGVVQGLTCKAGDRVDAGVALLEVVPAD